jgi:hypothetical protein
MFCYVCKTDARTKLQICGNKVPRKILSSDTYKLSMKWRKLHKQGTVSFMIFSFKAVMGWACSLDGGSKRCTQNFLGNITEDQKNWNDNIKMDLMKTGFGDVNWIELY